MSKFHTPPNPHERAIIDNAESYTVFVFRGREGRHRREAASATEALALAATMANELGKPAMIYAIRGGASAYMETVNPA